MAQWETHFVEPVVFETTDPYQIACLLDAFCQQELGAAAADVLFYESSIGAVCGMRLQDGRRVVVNVHQPSHTLEFLQAVVRVQRYLLAHGYPCTKPLLDPQPLAYGFATIEEFVDEEAQAFVAEYEAARGRPFSYEEHQTLVAGKIHGLAYSARCEHALHPYETICPEGSSRSLLARYRI